MSGSTAKGKKVAKKKNFNIIKVVKQFWDEVLQELKKSVWPTRAELFESTMVVIVSVILVAIYVSACDFVFQSVMRILF